MARNANRKFISDIATSYSYPLPVRLCPIDEKLVRDIESAEVIIVLPSWDTKRSLHKSYLGANKVPQFNVSLLTFIDALRKDLPFIRISTRVPGICDISFVFRDKARTTSDHRLMEDATNWRENLNAADITRQLYRDSQMVSHLRIRDQFPQRLPMGTMSHYYAKQPS